MKRMQKKIYLIFNFVTNRGFVKFAHARTEKQKHVNNDSEAAVYNGFPYNIGQIIENIA